MTIEETRLRAVVGFEGSITDGLVLLPDGETLAFALGSTIVLRNKDDVSSQAFLRGHTDQISCLAVSPSGRFLASGQVTHMGFIADIILWSLPERKLLHRMQLHKAKVQALDISSDDRHLISLGGEDDNSIVLWDIETGCAICGSPTDGNFMRTVKFLHHSNATVVTAGHYNLSVWEFDEPNNKLRSHVVKLGQRQRLFETIDIDKDDRYVYAGTTSGDVLQIDIAKRLLRRAGPHKNLIPGGVTAAQAQASDGLFVGCGDGTVKLLTRPDDGPSAKAFREAASVSLFADAAISGTVVTSLILESEDAEGITLLIGTKQSEVYRLIFNKREKSFKQKLLQTSHSESIHDVVFPPDYSAVFATCGAGNIRIWHLKTCRELLRIVVANLDCHCLGFTHDGSRLVSGWSDGAIRVFTPQSGKLVFKRSDAHHRAVRALATSSDGALLITGGDDGTVRVWNLLEHRCDLVASMKEHKSAVTAIRTNPVATDEFVSCSEDGSCVIWDLSTFHRRSSFFAATCFKAVAYHPDGSQIITAGTDRKISYWDPFDAQAIRIMDGSATEPVEALAIDPHGDSIISGGGDMTLRLWSYDEGHCYSRGHGHSGAIQQLAISPDATRIVSVGAEGGVFVWDYTKPVPLNNHETTL